MVGYIFQRQRYVIYAQLLRAKIDEFPDLDISITNTTIGEVDEVQSIDSNSPPAREPSETGSANDSSTDVLQPVDAVPADVQSHNNR